MDTVCPIGRYPKESTMKEGDIADSVVGRLEQVMLEAGIGDRQIRKQMANICGITVQAIAQWFDGRTKAPAAENIAAICAFYNADLMWVITGHPNARMYAHLLKRRIACREKEIQSQSRATPAKKKTKVRKLQVVRG